MLTCVAIHNCLWREFKRNLCLPTNDELPFRQPVSPASQLARQSASQEGQPRNISLSLHSCCKAKQPASQPVSQPASQPASQPSFLKAFYRPFESLSKSSERPPFKSLLKALKVF
jgi:hypothetical protein